MDTKRHTARPKSANTYTHPERVKLLEIIKKFDSVTVGQLAQMTGISWGRLQWHLYVLEREKKIVRYTQDRLVYVALAQQHEE